LNVFVYGKSKEEELLYLIAKLIVEKVLKDGESNQSANVTIEDTDYESRIEDEPIPFTHTVEEANTFLQLNILAINLLREA
jgi:hypothetical protein